MKAADSITLMEPMLPPDGESRLEDLAIDVATKASGLASQLPLAARQGIGDIVRSMNCYYSNLIEGHDTHPAILTALCLMTTIRLMLRRKGFNTKPLPI
jgi:hypothetical protein